MTDYSGIPQAYENGDLYAMPGIPYVVTTTVSSSLQTRIVATAGTGSISELVFPSLTTFFVLTNTMPSGTIGGNIRVGFSPTGITGSNNNYFTMSPQQTISLELRTPYLYFSGSNTGSFELIAGMSNAWIPNRTSFPIASGNLAGIG